MRVLVTGATGFIGGALFRRLDADNEFAVTGSVRRSAQADGRQSLSAGTLDPDTDWSDMLRDIDGLLHTAARVHKMGDSAADSLALYRRTNVIGTLNLAQQAAAADVRRFVFLSSIKVNGERTPRGQPFTPGDGPAPVDPYGLSKWEAEQGLMKLARETGMEVVIVRPSLVYGPGVKANFRELMRWVRRRWPLPLAGVDNRRSMIALDNLVDLLVECLVNERAGNRVFLAADGQDLSTPNLLRLVGDAMSRPARLYPMPNRLLQVTARLLGKGEQLARLLESLQVDVRDTREVLGWLPPLGVEEALNKTVQAFLESGG